MTCTLGTLRRDVCPFNEGRARVSEVRRYRHRVAKRRPDRWVTGQAISLSEAAYGGPVCDPAAPDPVHAWITFHDGSHEVEARVLAHTERAVLVEWGFGQGADCAWVWRDAARATTP